MKIQDLMTKDVVSVRTDATLKDVAEILSVQRISGLPVLDEEGRLVGVVSEADILTKARGKKREGGILTWLGDGRDVAARKLLARTAGEAMTAPVVFVSPTAPVFEAATLMVDRNVNRLPVVDAEGRLVGIVTRADLVRAFTRSDDEIAREVREDVLLHALWIDPTAIDVQVENGEVTLVGQVETRGTAELAELFARRVLGVVAVHSKLGWCVDDKHPSERGPLAVPML